jgi:uncharacterized protein YdaU (DUF1376 family)
MSKPDTWMPLYIGDYLADTMHLTAQEHGAYLLLLMHYWRTGPLPDDAKMLSGIARVDRKDWDRDVGPVLRRFFTSVGGFLHQKRIDAEREKAEQLSSKRASAAAARWSGKDKQARSNSNANASANAHANAPDMDMPGISPYAPASPSQSQEEPSLRSGRGEGRVVEAAALFVGPAEPAPDARTALFREGLDRLTRLTGQPARQGRSLLGRLLQHAQDDAAMLSLVLAECEATRPADPVSWLTRAVQARSASHGGGFRRDAPSKRAWAFQDEDQPRRTIIEG